MNDSDLLGLIPEVHPEDEDCERNTSKIENSIWMVCVCLIFYIM